MDNCQIRLARVSFLEGNDDQNILFKGAYIH